jgi:hypothetical protein
MKCWTDQKVSLLVALIGLFVSLTAACLAYGATQNSTKAQYVGLAISVLREAPRSQSDAELRGWATDVLKTYAGVPVPEKVLEDLRSGRLTLPGCGAISEAPDTFHGEGKVEEKGATAQ